MRRGIQLCEASKLLGRGERRGGTGSGVGGGCWPGRCRVRSGAEGARERLSFTRGFDVEIGRKKSTLRNLGGLGGGKHNDQEEAT